MMRVKFVKLVQFVKFVVGVVCVGMFLTIAGAQGPAPSQTAGFMGEEQVRFGAVDVVVDSKGVGLGAYQIEVKAPEGVEIVGLEGGEGVFKEAPFYDPKALMGRRIVVAGFSTEEVGKLPKGAGRVARLHLQISGREGVPALEKKLIVATDAGGKTIAASVALRVYEGAER